MPKLSDAPGCIGSFVVRDMSHPMCRECIFRTVCGKMAEIARERLAVELRMEPDEIRPKTTVARPRSRAHQSVTRKPAQPSLSLRGGLLLKQLRRQGVVRERLAKGEVDLARIEPRFAAVGLVALNHGPLPRKRLTELLRNKFSWDDGQAQSHAAMLTDVLRHLDMLSEGDGDILKLEVA